MYDPQKHNRQSIRLSGKDYTESGNYFITLCVHGRYSLFGSILRGRMIRNDFGDIAHKQWMRTGKIRKNIQIDEFIVMPNHLHGIITIQNRDCTGTVHRVPTDRTTERESFGKPTSNSIPTIIRSYKATVTKQINQINGQPGDKIWQRNYFERVIRNPTELNKVREYIRCNPQKWWQDRLRIKDKSL